MDIPIFCDLSAVDDDERVRLHELTAELLARVTAVQSDDHGHDLEFDGAGPELVAKIADWLEMDSRCCPFAEHALVIPRGGAPVRVSLRGGAGVGPALRTAIEANVPAEVLAAAR